MFHLRPLHWMCAFDILQSKYQGFGFSSAPFSSLWWLVKWNSDYVVNQGLGKLSHDRGRNILTWRIRFAQKRCFQRPFVWSSVSWVYANLDWLVVSTPLKNISQLGWLFPKYGTIKTMFQTTNQWMFPTRRNEKAKWLASARTSQWDPMDRLRNHSRSSCSHFSTNILLVQNQRTLTITRYHKISQVADTQLPNWLPSHCSTRSWNSWSHCSRRSGSASVKSWDSADSGTTFWSFDWQCHGKRAIYMVFLFDMAKYPVRYVKWPEPRGMGLHPLVFACSMQLLFI